MLSKYRLVEGLHFGRDVSGAERMYKPGDVVETDSDLLTLNGQGMSPKFQLLQEAPKVSKETDQREDEDMTAWIARLQGMADQEQEERQLQAAEEGEVDEDDE